ncbi:MAG: GlsB/YeaQ/YmgE family stress response membrane protein [Actinomycetota bacterium]|nr:GlsB/YeaQ/YmgE family stress response membrane protein [Actinomycetota bacterium]
MLWFIIVLLFVGFIAGALARLLVPGPDPMSLAGTWLLGVLGSFAGGFLGYVLFGNDTDDGVIQVSGIIGSVLGAVILLLVYRAVSSRRGGERVGAR